MEFRSTERVFKQNEFRVDMIRIGRVQECTGKTHEETIEFRSSVVPVHKMKKMSECGVHNKEMFRSSVVSQRE